MIASHVTLPTLVQAAQTIGVRLETHSLSTMRHRVKLLPETPQTLYKPPCKRCRDYRTSALLVNPDRTNWATCRCRRKGGAQGDAKYQRVDARGNDRRVNAICWHGFRDYFRAVYQTTPKARFSTSLDTWKDAEDFELRFRESGHKNIGSQMYHMAFAEACRCPESGSVIERAALSPEQMREVYEYGLNRAPSLRDPVSLAPILLHETDDMGVDDILVQPEGVSVERWSDYNAKMNALLMGRS